MIKRGLPYVEFGGRWYIHGPSAEAYLEALMKTQLGRKWVDGNRRRGAA